ncbi:MAG: DUF2235 domain-containing protein [Pseudomonadota bacterium]
MANIVICADGTWNRPEEDLEKDHATNVLKIARAVKPKSGALKQHVFYDWGLGSYHSAVTAGVSGRGIHKNIVDGYRYIVQNYAPNDNIYLFGFSRGAYTVRALCGLINNCGIVKREDAKLIQRAWEIYKMGGNAYKPDGEGSIAFRERHSHRSRKVHFVGVWDTVGSLGVPFGWLGLLDRKDEFYDTKMGNNVVHARHAVAIDEQREDFAPTLWNKVNGVDLKQVWFSGVHSDVGGSYPPDKITNTVASDTPLAWMISEAKSRGLKFESHITSNLSDGSLAPLHKSRRHIYRFRDRLHRDLVDLDRPTSFHTSVRKRYEADTSYRPKKLKSLVDSVGWSGLDIET